MLTGKSTVGICTASSHYYCHALCANAKLCVHIQLCVNVKLQGCVCNNNTSKMSQSQQMITTDHS